MRARLIVVTRNNETIINVPFTSGNVVEALTTSINKFLDAVDYEPKADDWQTVQVTVERE